MKIITKKRVNKAIDEIIDVVFENADYEIETNGFQDYDVVPDIPKKDTPKVANIIYKILADKKPRQRVIIRKQIIIRNLPYK